MTIFPRWPAGALALALCACGTSQPPSAASLAASAPPDTVAHLVDRYWKEAAPAEVMRDDTGQPLSIAPQMLADTMALERRYLAELSAMPHPAAISDDSLTYDLFKRGLELDLEGFLYPAELMPLDAFDGMPLQFARMAAGSGRQRFLSVADYDGWLRRCAEFAAWSRQATANLRDGLRRGYVLPAAVVRRVVPQLEALGEDTADSVFYRAVSTLPKSIGDADRARLEQSLDAAVKRDVLPAYRQLNEFLKNEYLPRARASVGLAALPLGDRWYAYLVKRATGSMMKPADIHAEGLAEVDKLKARMQALLADAGFSGSAAEYLDPAHQDPHAVPHGPEELVAAYQDLATHTNESAGALFALQPKTEYDVRGISMPAVLHQRTLWYRPAAVAGAGRGVVFIDTAGIAAATAIVDAPAFLREAVPGRQYQSELQYERSDLPNLRRFARDYPFEEAWKEYAAGLGEELGTYREPRARAEWMARRLRCAAGAVLDTGLHARGWSRQQALDYWQAQVPLADDASVDRMIGEPARALACQLGLERLTAIRAHAQAVLGERFDLKSFHAALLEDGAMPLDLVDAKIKRWIKTVP